MAAGQDIVSVIKRQIEEFGADLSLIDVGTVIEVGPLEILNVEKKLGISGKINHLFAQVTKVKEGSDDD